MLECELNNRKQCDRDKMSRKILKRWERNSRMLSSLWTWSIFTFWQNEVPKVLLFRDGFFRWISPEMVLPVLRKKNFHKNRKQMNASDEKIIQSGEWFEEDSYQKAPRSLRIRSLHSSFFECCWAFATAPKMNYFTTL